MSVRLLSTGFLVCLSFSLSGIGTRRPYHVLTRYRPRRRTYDRKLKGVPPSQPRPPTRPLYGVGSVAVRDAPPREVDKRVTPSDPTLHNVGGEDD